MQLKWKFFPLCLENWGNEAARRENWTQKKKKAPHFKLESFSKRSCLNFKIRNISSSFSQMSSYRFSPVSYKRSFSGTITPLSSGLEPVLHYWRAGWDLAGRARFSRSASCNQWWLAEWQWLSWQGCHRWHCCLVVPKARHSGQRAVRCQGEELS